MARSINCDMCGLEPAGAMYSNLDDGSAVAVGENCAPAFVAGLAQAVGLVALPADQVPAEMGGTLVMDTPGGGEEGGASGSSGTGRATRKSGRNRHPAPHDPHTTADALAGPEPAPGVPEEVSADASHAS
jgi:hypothetical protein